MELQGKRVAILVEDAYDDLELWYPYLRMREAGAEVRLLGASRDTYASQHGYPLQTQQRLGSARSEDFDAVIVPGEHGAGEGADPRVRDFVRRMYEAGKLVAFIGRPRSIAAEEVLKGHTVTSYPTLQSEIERAGAKWIDEAVVVDGNLISSRQPEDLPEFCRQIIGTLGEGPVSQGHRQADIKLY